MSNCFVLENAILINPAGKSMCIFFCFVVDDNSFGHARTVSYPMRHRRLVCRSNIHKMPTLLQNPLFSIAEQSGGGYVDFRKVCVTYFASTHVTSMSNGYSNHTVPRGSSQMLFISTKHTFTNT